MAVRGVFIGIDKYSDPGTHLISEPPATKLSVVGAVELGKRFSGAESRSVCYTPVP